MGPSPTAVPGIGARPASQQTHWKGGIPMGGRRDPHTHLIGVIMVPALAGWGAGVQRVHPLHAVGLCVLPEDGVAMDQEPGRSRGGAGGDK